MDIKILIPANLRFSSGIREISKEAAIQAGFSKKQANMFRLVLDELFMNAIRYGSDARSKILLEVIIEKEKLIGAIEDEGKGNKKITAQELQALVEKGKSNVSLVKTHGRGLAQITSELVDELEITNNEVTGGIRIEFSMAKTEEEIEHHEEKTEKTEKLLPEKTVEISGHIDMSNIDKITHNVDQIITKYQNKSFRLIFDFSYLTYFNSVFINKLAEWYSILEKNQGEGVIYNPQQNILDTLDVIGLTNVFVIKYSNNEKKEPTPVS